MKKITFNLGLKYLQNAGLRQTPEFKKEQLDIWWELLQDLTDDYFLTTCKKIAMESVFFPSIGEIRKPKRAEEQRPDYLDNNLGKKK